MFPYYVNHGMEFLRVQEQNGMVCPVWQKEDGKECFTKITIENNTMRITLTGGKDSYSGDVVEKEMSNGRKESSIQWDGDWMKEIVERSDPSFVRKTYRVYVISTSIITVYYDGEYDSKKRYVYTKWDMDGKLKSRGLVSGNLREVYPFKKFKDSEMTEYEYDYDVKNGVIDKDTKKEIYRGIFVNSMKRGYPRDDNPQRAPSSGPNAGGSQERLPSADATGTNDLIQSVNLRTDREGTNKGAESPIYYSNKNQENGVGERVDEGKKEGGNDSHGSDDSTIPVTNRYSSITTIDDIGVNCEHIRLQDCPDCYGNLGFSELSGLVSVVIDDDSLNNATLITFNWMSQLESITIGARSFTAATGLSIANCAKLESLKIGPHSFKKATSFIVMNCDSLKSITIGNDTETSINFMNCNELVLSSE